MTDCHHCPVEPYCHYPYKPCDCVHQRKFWDEQRRADWDSIQNPTPAPTQEPRE